MNFFWSCLQRKSWDFFEKSWTVELQNFSEYYQNIIAYPMKDSTYYVVDHYILLEIWNINFYFPKGWYVIHCQQSVVIQIFSAHTRASHQLLLLEICFGTSGNLMIQLNCWNCWRNTCKNLSSLGRSEGQVDCWECSIFLFSVRELNLWWIWRKRTEMCGSENMKNLLGGCGLWLKYHLYFLGWFLDFLCLWYYGGNRLFHSFQFKGQSVFWLGRHLVCDDCLLFPQKCINCIFA